MLESSKNGLKFDFVLRGGKYDGRKIYEVMLIDPAYLFFMAENGFEFSYGVKQCLKYFIKKT